jgi:hypothetical protein
MALVVARLNERGEAVGELTLTRAAATRIGPGAILVVAREASDDAVALVADPMHQALVNGHQVPLGLRVLRRSDECRTDDGILWRFLGDHGPIAVAFASPKSPVRCRRCMVEIDVGTPAVRCPACRQWFHEQATLRCWSSIPLCGHCGHPTAGGTVGLQSGA